jgi:hypothetical protein
MMQHIEITTPHPLCINPSIHSSIHLPIRPAFPFFSQASDSFQLMGMADRGQLPRFLAARSKYGTPTFGIALSSIGVIALGGMDFTSIVEMVNILYVFAELIEFAAYVKLRQMRQRGLLARADGLGRPSSSSSSSAGGSGDSNGGGAAHFDAMPCAKTALQAALAFAPACVVLAVIVLLSSVTSWLAAAVSIVGTVLVYIVTCAARAHVSDLKLADQLASCCGYYWSLSFFFFFFFFFFS